MAISTYKIFLMMKKSEAWEKVVDIKEFPDLGGAPEMLETTTLSDPMQTYIAGIQSLDALEFTGNYTKEDYTKLKALGGKEEEYAVWFGGTEGAAGAPPTPTGTDGKFKFKSVLLVAMSECQCFCHDFYLLVLCHAPSSVEIGVDGAMVIVILTTSFTPPPFA